MLRAPLLLVAVLLGSQGCTLLLKPSERTRQASYNRARPHLEVEEAQLLQSTYLVFSSDAPLAITPAGPDSFDLSAEARRGLAVAVAADGYLLTAAHVTAAATYVYGPFDGTLALRSARVVEREAREAFGAEIALIKVDAAVVAARLLPNVAAGEIVLALVTAKKAGIELHFAGGQIHHTTIFPDGSRLLQTNVPVWYGDSGGPLFTTRGDLVAVSTAFVFRAGLAGFDYRRYAFAPSAERLARWIDADRRHIASRSLGEVEGQR